jgi:hypothetical protein
MMNSQLDPNDLRELDPEVAYFSARFHDLTLGQITGTVRCAVEWLESKSRDRKSRDRKSRDRGRTTTATSEATVDLSRAARQAIRLSQFSIEAIGMGPEAYSHN